MSPFDDAQPQSLVPHNKKPRHRHSPTQLAALNQLFDQNEHPPLEQRSALADRLGMETKTVNAWFQNKRASSKKRVRSHAVQYDSQPINTVQPPPSSNPPPALSTHEIHRTNDIDDMHDDDAASLGLLHSRSASVAPPDYPPPFHPPLSDQAYSYPDADSLPRRTRPRPTLEQSDELKKIYNVNPHPSTEQRQSLSARIGMSRSISPPFAESWSYFSRGAVPSDYGRSSPARFGSRLRRSRPEPYQLDALKDLYHKTSTPTIEERSALALEIGMDVGKVTNWFRNLRQTARKRTKRSGSPGDDDDDFDAVARDAYSASLALPLSRVGTPTFGSSSSSSMNGDGEDSYMQLHAHSDNGSEDDYQEAVTPSPEHSPPPPQRSNVVDDRSERLNTRKEYRSSLETLSMPYPDPVTTTGKVSPSGINYDDAMLLISFHRGISGRDLPPY